MWFKAVVGLLFALYFFAMSVVGILQGSDAGSFVILMAFSLGIGAYDCWWLHQLITHRRKRKRFVETGIEADARIQWALARLESEGRARPKDPDHD